MDQLSFPDGELARAARFYLSANAPDTLVHHSMLAYLFAGHVAQLRGLRPGTDFDDELVFLSCVLHDLGLTAAGNGDHRFEVDGADVAVRFLRDRGVSADRASSCGTPSPCTRRPASPNAKPLRSRSPSTASVWTSLASAPIKTGQLLGSLAAGWAWRAFDVDDLIRNTVGALLGLGVTGAVVMLTERS